MLDAKPLISTLNIHSDDETEASSDTLPASNSTGIDTPLTATFQRNPNRRAELAPENHLMSVISPRSGNYERLEGGMGPSRMGGNKRFTWRKFAIAAAGLVTLVWLFAPRSSQIVLPGGTEHEHSSSKPPPSPGTKLQHPTSFKNDPNPSSSTYCTTPHSGQRLVQYALMIDAGSTGSRIHVYKFNNCGPAPAYEYETFKMTEKEKGGLSKYAGDPKAAAESLDVLMDEALRVVPESLRKCSPVAVKATAGLRLLPGNQSDDILKAVERHLQGKYPFPFKSAVVMDGRDEGIFAWITANYLLHAIPNPSNPKGNTHAVLDLGGASTQIVFKPNFDKSKADSELKEGEHKYDLAFAGQHHMLYQHSYLGYGVMKVREHVHQLVDFMHSIRAGVLPDHPSSSWGQETLPKIANPCLAVGTSRRVEVGDNKGKKHNVTMAGEDIGSFESCQRLMELVLAKDAICEAKPCSFNGVYQPSILDTFSSGSVLLLSYFYDRIEPLLPKSSKSSGAALTLPIAEVANLAKQVCKGPSAWEQSEWGRDPQLMKDLKERPEWCLDLTFQHTLLRLGYGFDETRVVQLGKSIDGTELGWALGAGIELVGAHVQCLA